MRELTGLEFASAIEEHFAGDFSTRLILMKTPTCAKCIALFQKFPELKDLEFEAFTFGKMPDDQAVADRVTAALEKLGINSAPSTIDMVPNATSTRSFADVDELADFIKAKCKGE